jgi:hypothetical protein
MWAAAAAVQNLPPEGMRLRRIKDHVRDDFAQLPNCTCLETITRFHKEAHATRLRSLDRIGLEVVYNNGHEWYGSPGARDLSEENPTSFIGAGMISNGIFGITLHNLFSSDLATFTERGADALAGHAAIRYDFRLSQKLSGLNISIPGGSGNVGEAGSFWVDAKTFDLLRLEARAEDIPAYLPLTSATYTVDYTRTRIGAFDAALVKQADLDLKLGSGVEDYDHFDFTHCRAFEAHSNIRFEEKDTPSAPAESARTPSNKPEPRLPALLLVTVRLTTPISASDTVGKLIEGRVVGTVQWKGRPLLADGAVVHGRLRRCDYDAALESNAVALEFTEVDVNGVWWRFYADLLKFDKLKEIESASVRRTTLRNRNVLVTTIQLPELPGVASFFVKGRSFTLRAGFQTVWRTRGPLLGLDW